MTVRSAVQFFEQLRNRYKDEPLLFQLRNGLVEGLDSGFIPVKVMQEVDGSGLRIGDDAFPAGIFADRWHPVLTALAADEGQVDPIVCVRE